MEKLRTKEKKKSFCGENMFLFFVFFGIAFSLFPFRASQDMFVPRCSVLFSFG